MQKFLLLTACLAVGAFAAQAAPQGAKLPTPFKKAAQARQAKQQGKSYALRAAESANLWRAATQKSYGWNGEEWELDETYSFQYDGAGLPIVEEVVDYEGYVNRQTMTYNDNGMLATRLTEVAEESGAPFTETERLAREYDSRLISFITFNDQTVLSGNNWIPSNCYKQIITRDEAGNVTLMERAVYYQGEFDPTYRLFVEYGEDGTAISISEQNLTMDYDTEELVWEDGDTFTNIIWDSTDGQIVSMENLFSGANRVKSCTLVSEGMEAEIVAEYSEDGGYEAHLTAYNPEEDEDIDSWVVFTPLDENGSSKTRTVTNYIYDGFPYFTDEIIETYVYDENGLILLEEVKSGDGYNTWIEGRIEGEVEYDATYGYPLVWTLSEYDPDEFELYPVFRAEYSDYVGLTGVDNIAVGEGSDEAPVYYDLQGRRIAAPSQGGIYIRRSGTKVEKVIL